MLRVFALIELAAGSGYTTHRRVEQVLPESRRQFEPRVGGTVTKILPCIRLRHRHTRVRHGRVMRPRHQGTPVAACGPLGSTVGLSRVGARLSRP
jgi:hypothetical protein